MIAKFGLFAASAASLLVTAAAATPADAQARGANAVQRRDDRADGDRWKRAEDRSSATQRGSDDRDKDVEASSSRADDDDDDEKDKPAHKGELNGKLDLGEWE